MGIGRVLLVAAALMFGSTTAGAATLDVSGGELVGAFNVDVGGTLYDVTFVDSSPQSPFAFTTLEDATAASQALLDQVFIDFWDTDPSGTLGCTDLEQCIALTPYHFSPPTLFLVGAINGDDVIVADQVLAGSVTDVEAITTFGVADQVMAYWTPVPEPSTALLLAAGLVGLGLRRRQRKPD